MQLLETDTVIKRRNGVATDRMQGAGRMSTAVLLWVGMAVVYILSVFVWLHFTGHAAKR